jgi:excisionase family DNA binding protein
MASSNSRRLLTRSKACERLGIGLSTFKRLVAEGQLHEVQIGRARRLPEAEIGRYIKARLDEVEDTRRGAA